MEDRTVDRLERRNLVGRFSKIDNTYTRGCCRDVNLDLQLTPKMAECSFIKLHGQLIAAAVFPFNDIDLDNELFSDNELFHWVGSNTNAGRRLPPQADSLISTSTSKHTPNKIYIEH